MSHRDADRVPAWVSVAALVLVGWRMWAALRPARGLRLPGTLVRTLLAAVMVLGVLARFHTLNGLSAGTALLILMGASKLLETSSQRDELIVVAVSLFLLLAAVLDRQNLLRTPLYLVQVWICCTAIAVIGYAPTSARREPGTARGFDDRSALKLAARTLLLATPLALLMFLFFPRLAGAFWALPRGDLATTGLSDTMTPGSITRLTDVLMTSPFGCASTVLCRRRRCATGAVPSCTTSTVDVATHLHGALPRESRWSTWARPTAISSCWNPARSAGGLPWIPLDGVPKASCFSPRTTS